MALNAYAALTLNGTALDGDTSVSQLGGVDVSDHHIEVYEVRWGASVATAGSAVRPGRAELAPVAVSKRIDQTTPLLYQGLLTGHGGGRRYQAVRERSEHGAARHRFTLAIAKARIQSIDSRSPDTFDLGTTADPAREVVTIAAGTMTWRDEVTGVEYTHTVAAR